MDGLFSTAGAAGWGYAPLSALPLSDERTAALEALCPGAVGVFVAAFPYFAGEISGNLSLYARGEDYHRVLTRRLTSIADGLREQYPTHQFVPGADNSPVPETAAALAAGVGMLGRNGLVILPPYGSYLFLGTILTDRSFPYHPTPPRHCENCGACVRACPGGALDALSLDESRCLSAISQKKGELSTQEAALLQASPLIWGCDRCQQVCPHNRKAEHSTLPEFTQGLLHSLTLADVQNLSNRTLKERYGDRAFSWRGAAVLKRNLALKEGTSQT